ncbi:MAG TPA: hypothetical protein HPP77_10105 [Candidatus Hydrogenedentes bacterium]|nr:hypothetical protein [Candidatus Hydrogenedentota bacterium]HIJ73888.1 hypothetical protein [Candidatus Hydrogenedentota bacterium]
MPSDFQDAKDHQFEEIRTGAAAPSHKLDIADLQAVRLVVSAELGRCKMLVRDVLELRRGSVVPLDKLAGEMTDIFVSGRPFARGEVIPLGDALHVRIGEVIGASDKEGDPTSED